MKILLALAALLQAGTTPAGLNPADYPQQKKLTENIYVWSDVHPSGLYTTNNLIVITKDGVLVADGQRDAGTTRKLVDGIRALTPQPIKIVVIGSEHGDHTGGNASFPASVSFVKAPLAAGKRTVITLGGTEIHVLDLGRAHTGTDLEVYLPKEKILFASEAYSNHIFPNMRAAVPSEWVRTVKNISELDIFTIIPGHGHVADGPSMKASLKEFSSALQHIIAEATRLHHSGESVDGAAKQANWGPYAGWVAADRNAQVAVQRVYDEIDGKLK
jgi:glyoxylase-like metal-dependent hydrolase (beta-lactamase superfamily II)